MDSKQECLSNKEFARRLEERTKRFAIQIIRLSSGLDRNPASKVICYQLIKSATSIGANYREANRAVSRADFRAKISVCVKEASETQYWLELLQESGLVNTSSVAGLHKECSEFLALFSTIYQRSLKK